MVAAAVIGSAVVGGVVSTRNANRATNAQTRASQQAIDAQNSSEMRALEMQRPFYEAGYAATAAMMDMAGLPRGGAATAGASNHMVMPGGSSPEARAMREAGFRSANGVSRPTPAGTPADPTDLSSYPKYNWQQDPGYQFRMDEGMRGVERSAAARGVLNSGGTLRGIERYGQNFASNEYQRVFDRIATIAGHGQGAANTGSDIIVNNGMNTGRALINAGEARASGYIAQGNAWSNAANQIGTYAGYRSGTAGGGWGEPSDYAGTGINPYTRRPVG